MKVIEGIVDQAKTDALNIGGIFYNRSKYNQVPEYDQVRTGDTVKLLVEGRMSHDGEKEIFYITRLKIIKSMDF